MTTITSWPDIIVTATAHLSSIDPIMADTIAQVGPCMLVPNPDIFEALVDAIISQQISVKAADAIVARVRAATPNGVITPEALAPFDFDALRALGLSTPKVRYIHNLVAQVTSGQLDLARLPQLDEEAVIQQLVAL